MDRNEHIEPMLDDRESHATIADVIGIDELVLISRIVEGVSGQALTLVQSSTLKSAYHAARRTGTVTLDRLAAVLHEPSSARAVD